MKHSHSKILYSMILAFVTAATTGCGNDESAAKSEQPSASNGDTWFDANPIQQMYAGQIRMEAVEAGKSEADMSCKAILPMAKDLLSNSGSGMTVQIMYKLCSNAGLKFQRELRCEADRLQVLCR